MSNEEIKDQADETVETVNTAQTSENSEETQTKTTTAKEEPVAVAPKSTSKKTASAKTTDASDDFDWDADEAGFQTYSEADRKKLEDAYTQSFSPVSEKQVVKGRVVSIGEKDVVINIGFKSDGMVSRQEFRDLPDLKAGDEVEVFVDVAEDAMGQLILSRRKAMQETAWDKIVEAHNSDAICTGYVEAAPKVVSLWMCSVLIPSSLALKLIPNPFVIMTSMWAKTWTSKL